MSSYSHPVNDIGHPIVPPAAMKTEIRCKHEYVQEAHRQKWHDGWNPQERIVAIVVHCKKCGDVSHFYTR